MGLHGLEVEGEDPGVGPLGADRLPVEGAGEGEVVRVPGLAPDFGLGIGAKGAPAHGPEGLICGGLDHRVGL